MKISVAVLAGMAAMVSGVMAEPLVLQPTKDVRIMCDPSEMEFNGGQATRLRMRAPAQQSAEIPILDFDRAEIQKFMEANKDKKITATLSVVVREVAGVGDTPVKVELGALDTASDWIEGEQMQGPAKKGESSAAEAQAQTRKWTTAAGQEVDSLKELIWRDGRIATLVNNSRADVKQNTAGRTIQIQLDDAFLKHVATDANCRGVYLFCLDGTAMIDLFSREQSGRPPRLTLAAE
jgi:hypothetical protein